jgi:hypothetical protein
MLPVSLKRGAGDRRRLEQTADQQAGLKPGVKVMLKTLMALSKGSRAGLCP